MCDSWDFNCAIQECDVGDVVTWNQLSCPSVYSQALNIDVNGRFNYTIDALHNTQSHVSVLFSNFLSNHVFTDDTSNPNYSPFQENIRDLCIDPAVPGICEPSLNLLCSNYSRTQVEESNILSDLCGCYVPPDQTIIEYTLGSTPCLTGQQPCVSCIPGQTGCSSLPACDPLCRRSTTSQKANPPDGNFITCPVSICAIDEVTVNKDVTFNQVCSGCGAGGCICVISGVNTDQVASGIGLGTNFNQFCGSNSVCITNGIAGPCPDPEDLPLPTFSTLPSWGILAIVGISLLMLGIAIFFG